MWKASEPSDLDTVLKDERAAIAARRKKLNLPPPEDDLVGIALSGGGVRSATVSLGVLDVLNRNGFLEKADYLSSVSGGGYTASYVHATLKKHGSGPASFANLFTEENIRQLRNHGSYLASTLFGYFKLAGAFIFSFFMNLVWVLALFVVLGATANYLFLWIDSRVAYLYSEVLLCAAIFVFLVHFFLHGFRRYFWSSNILYKVEGIIIILAIPYAAHLIFNAFANAHGVFTRVFLACNCTSKAGHLLSDLLFRTDWRQTIAVSLAILGFIGFFANPNILTFHRFYRDSLARAYLFLVKGVDRAFKLFTLNPGKTPDEWGAAPYPLINTCLNLLGRDPEHFSGTSTNEHFILSPLYCGSKLTGYAPSNGPAYKSMTLATAMAVSGAAVNPDMGYKTNRFLAFAMTILNLRLGYWAPNPRFQSFPGLTWWPFFHIAELISRTNANRMRVLLSDGGHIENLGVFELLRRRCRLIFAVDAGADPDFTFQDLQELIIQARNILGVKIEFSVMPETVIRPEPSHGYSRAHFAVASISDLPGAYENLKGYRGILIYVKASLKAPDIVRKTKEPSYLYKTWHPAFPHESTADQFFDEPQWNAYYTLGKDMAEEVLRNVLGNGMDTADSRGMAAGQWYSKFESKLREQLQEKRNPAQTDK